MTRQELIEGIGGAIATMEGFFKEGSLSQRNNNPGNLRSWGKNPVVSGYVKFPTVEVGMKALESQIGKNIDRGLTLVEFFNGKPGVYGGYSPSSDGNDPLAYAQYVAGRVGVSPTVRLDTLYTTT